MQSVRRIAASFLLLTLMASCLGAQSARPEELVLHAFALKHRPAGEALALVSPLLSDRGTVELQPRTNTLVIRDTMAHLRKIVPTLRAYDHPARPLTLELYIVRASRSQVSPPVARSNLPEPLTRRLRSLLGYDSYDVQAQALLASLEGQAVTYAVGGEYEVSFRFGTLLPEQRVKLLNFRVFRRNGQAGPQPQLLIHTNLSLRQDQTTTLGLARSENSPEALMVVLTLRNGDVARRPTQRADQ